MMFRCDDVDIAKNANCVLTAICLPDCSRSCSLLCDCPPMELPTSQSDVEPTSTPPVEIGARTRALMDTRMASPSTPSNQLEAFLADDQIDSAFIHPASGNNFICEACDLLASRLGSGVIEHRSSAEHLAKVRALRNNPAFDLNEVAAYKGARIEWRHRQLATRRRRVPLQARLLPSS